MFSRNCLRDISVVNYVVSVLCSGNVCNTVVQGEGEGSCKQLELRDLRFSLR
jgi:hypothetical protein